MGKASKPHDNPVAEARRYIDNARQILSEKAGKEGSTYTDPKYVRMAGNTAYNGVLVALDAIIPAPERQRRKSVEHYQRGIQDKKLLTEFNIAYSTLHLTLGYDGNLSYTIAQEGLRRAEKIISYVEMRTTRVDDEEKRNN